MLRVFITGLFLGLLSISTTIESNSSDNRMVIFILQTDRQRSVLERDAVLMANTVQAANVSDSIQAFTTSGTEMFFFKIESKSLNQPQLKQAKNHTINDVRGFFLKLFNNPAKEREKDVDIAGAIAMTMDRFNYAPPYQRMVLIILGNGLQRDKFIDFEGCYPSDSWVEHPLSPFAAIKANSTKAKLEVVFVPQRSSYINNYHATKIERFYSLLFQRKQGQLIGFTYDHKSAEQLIIRGGLPSQRQVEPVDIYGPLSLTRVGGLTAEEGENQ